MFSPSYFLLLISFLKNIPDFLWLGNWPQLGQCPGFLLQPTSGLPLAHPASPPIEMDAVSVANSSTLPQRDGALEVL